MHSRLAPICCCAGLKTNTTSNSTPRVAPQAQRGRRNPTKQLWEQASSRVSKDLPDAEAMIRDTAWSGREARTGPLRCPSLSSSLSFSWKLTMMQTRATPDVLVSLTC